MMMIIPVYIVTWNDGVETLEFRVSQTELESFLRILLFNNIVDFSVKLEKGITN